LIPDPDERGSSGSGSTLGVTAFITGSSTEGRGVGRQESPLDADGASAPSGVFVVLACLVVDAVDVEQAGV
jgi:hypothetical protein